MEKSTIKKNKIECSEKWIIILKVKPRVLLELT